MTLVFAILFTAFQGVEYANAGFTIADGVYGTCFYFSTGFHGFHVLVGTIFIGVAFYRIITYMLTDHHHLGFEASILYWHLKNLFSLFILILLIKYLELFFDQGVLFFVRTMSSIVFKPQEGSIKPDYLRQAIVGLLLGDGSLVKKYRGGGTYFKFAQGDSHVNYLNHVFDLFKQRGFVKMPTPTMITSVVKGVTHYYWQFSTVSLAA